MRERKLTKVMTLLGCGLLAGVVVAAAALPATAVAGVLAKSGIDAFDGLPSNFTSLPAPQSSVIYASDGKTQLATIYDENRRNVPLSEVAPIMRQAIVASEDIRFYQHNGVDFKGVARALVNNNSGGSSQGGSTLTMQYVRQSIVYSAKTPEEVVAASEKTNARKLREMKLAIALEKKLSKDQILERYLNIAPFGHNAWGIFAASHVYFGKDPKELTPPEATLLAGLVQAPSQYDPADTEHPEKKQAALERRNYVIDQLVKVKQATPAEADSWRKVVPTITGQQPTPGCISPGNKAMGAGFYCDFIYRWWLEQPAFGADPYERENRLRSGGYTVISSLDLNVQAGMKKAVEKRIGNTDKRALMLSAIEPSTGRVLGLVTNRDFSLDISGNQGNPHPQKKGQKGSFPNTTNPILTGGGGVSGFQAGSTFKMFTMVAGLEQGVPLTYAIDTQNPYHSKYNAGYGTPSSCPGSDDWCPRNFAKDVKGKYDGWSAFGSSINTYYVPLEEKVGADKVVDVARKMGIQFRARDDQDRAGDPDKASGWGAFTLGVSATTSLDVASAYSTLANDGRHCLPTPILEIRDSAGKKVDAGQPQCAKAIEVESARAAIDAARCPLGDRGGLGQCHGSTAGGVSGTVGKPVFGKTGTTDTNESASLVASTRQVTIAGIESDPDWQQDTSADHNHVNNAVAEALRDAMKDRPRQDFTKPSRSVAFGNGSQVGNPGAPPPSAPPGGSPPPRR